MGIPILVRRYLYIETALRLWFIADSAPMSRFFGPMYYHLNDFCRFKSKFLLFRYPIICAVYGWSGGPTGHNVNLFYFYCGFVKEEIIPLQHKMMLSVPGLGLYYGLKLLVFDLLGLDNWTVGFAGPMARGRPPTKTCHGAVHFKLG